MIGRENKKMLIIVLLTIIVITATIILLNKTNVVENIQDRLARNKSYEQPNGLSYMLYDNQDGILKMLAVIREENGIDSVEYESDGERIKVYGNKRTILGIDLRAQVNKEYAYKINSNGNLKSESILMSDNYLDNYFKYTKISEESTDELYKYGIEYFTDLKNDTITNYYTIGNNSTNWGEYSENIDLTISHMENIGDKTTTICAKQVNSTGDTIIDKRVFDIPRKGDFDVFANTLVTGKTMNDYGFTASFSNCQNQSFTEYNLMAGHETNNGNYSATFNLDFSMSNLQLLNAKQLLIDYILTATIRNGGISNVGASATLYYTDGTYEQQTIAATTYTTSTSKNITIDLDNTKELDYLQIKIWGYDANYSYSRGRVSNIVLKDVTL